MSIEPLQPAEGGLVPNPYRCFCKLVRRMDDAEADEDYASHKFDAGRQAQLAHDKQRMVKLPSEDELSEMVRVFLCLPAKETAHGLLKLLKGERA